MFFNVHSYFSLRYGTLSIESLVDAAFHLGLRRIALTDINNSSGVLDFVKLCKKHNIIPSAGIEIRDKGKLLYILLAKNIEGFHEVNSFVSYHNLNQIPYPQRPQEFENSFTIFPLENLIESKLLPNEFLGLKKNQFSKIYSSIHFNDHRKLVILHPVTLLLESDYLIHSHLQAIHQNVLLSKIDKSIMADRLEILLSEEEFCKTYKDYPVALKNTIEMCEQCSLDFSSGSKNKKTFTGSVTEDKILLEKLTWVGFTHRFPNNNSYAFERINKELNVIFELGFTPYFLITWDIIQFSLSKGFYYVGRGSGANSIVAYCLKITDVDPIELNLYFERFINPKRSSPPDFDIDYSWKDRDEVHKYIFQKHSNNNASLLGAMSTFRDRSILRELGKVYGLPKEEIDQFVDHPLSTKNNNEITQNILLLFDKIEDFPNIRSIHAGGVLITENPITYYTALDLPPKGFPTTQWDMYTAEDHGFSKYDILSQRGIGHINECVSIVSKNQNKNIDIHQVEFFKKDSKSIELLRQSKALGCFYIESPAMRGLISKLKCDNYLTLVAASSIIRPGVAKSGMMKEYIFRSHNPDKFKYLHPIMEEQLKETFGVMVYQEDVLKICFHFAGLDLAEADVLRRLMSGKPRYRSELEQIVNKFHENCRQRGYSDELIKEVWRQIQSFAGYSFSKAHSASYAAESFQSLYLKAHFPLEFMVAVINNFGGFYKTWVYFHEARILGGNILLPCVNHSEIYTCILGKNIYIGFVHVSNLETNFAARIIEERNQNGSYSGIEDFINRLRPGIEQIILLIRIGAFRFTEKSKSILLWETHLYLKKSKRESKTRMLFETQSVKYSLPQMYSSEIEDTYDEIELLGFPVSLTYFELLQTKFRGEIKAKEMLKHIGKSPRMLGLLVTTKYVWTIKKEIMQFGTFIDSDGEFFDTVHFPNSLKNYPFAGYGIYLLKGKITEEYGFPSMTVDKMAKMPIIKDPRY